MRIDFRHLYEEDEAVRRATAIIKRMEVHQIMIKRREVFKRMDDAMINERLGEIPKYLSPKNKRRSLLGALKFLFP